VLVDGDEGVVGGRPVELDDVAEVVGGAGEEEVELLGEGLGGGAVAAAGVGGEEEDFEGAGVAGGGLEGGGLGCRGGGRGCGGGRVRWGCCLGGFAAFLERHLGSALVAGGGGYLSGGSDVCIGVGSVGLTRHGVYQAIDHGGSVGEKIGCGGSGAACSGIVMRVWLRCVGRA